MLPHDESKECNARPLQRRERSERIDRKSQQLRQLDPKREVALEGTFTNHLADAIRSSAPIEREQAVNKALEAYEAALDEVLYEMLDKHFAAEASGASDPTSIPDS
jgi:hypothetical protein